MIRKEAIEAVYKRSLCVSQKETCVIVTDTIQESIARQFYEYIKSCRNDVRIEIMEPLKEHGEDPPESIASALLKCDVALLITNKSISHTKARRDASRNGARIASMPTITEDIANRCLDVNYGEIRALSEKVSALIQKAESMTITSSLGTDLSIERGNRSIHFSNGGIFDYPGAFGNLPEGEVAFGPMTAHGVYVVDGSFNPLGALTEPITCHVSDGYVIRIEGSQAPELKRTLDTVGKNAYRIAELGIGTNPKARTIGFVLEDEKVVGTCHIALGNDMSFGGTNNVPLHLDGILLRPTIVVNGTTLIDDGKALFI